MDEDSNDKQTRKARSKHKDNLKMKSFLPVNCSTFTSNFTSQTLARRHEIHDPNHTYVYLHIITYTTCIQNRNAIVITTLDSSLPLI